MSDSPTIAMPTTVSIIVKFWQEDGVWNAVTEDLPIAVFGERLDAAQAALREAVTEHFQMAHELGCATSSFARPSAAHTTRRARTTW